MKGFKFWNGATLILKKDGTAMTANEIMEILFLQGANKSQSMIGILIDTFAYKTANTKFGKTKMFYN